MNYDIEKEFEGLRLTAYQDSVGVWTIGYGHTKDVYPGQVITMDEAQAFLYDDLKEAIHAVHDLVHVPLTDMEESALVDFVFNLGSSNFSHSTLLKRLNGGDYEGAAEEFGKWNRAGGVVLAGLVRRRVAEAELFRKGMQNEQTTNVS